MTADAPDHRTVQLELITRLDDELRAMFEAANLRSGSGGGVLEARLERWRERAIADLRSVVALGAADRFAAVPYRPRWVQQETLLDVLERYHAHLVALFEDVELRPEQYTEPGIAPKPASRASPSGSVAKPRPRRALVVPDSVTMSWLWQNVPASLWMRAAMAVLALAGGMFALGVKLGQVDGFVQVVAPALRIDLPPKDTRHGVAITREAAP